MTRALLDAPEGKTRFEVRVGKPKPRDKAFVDAASAKYAENLTKAIADLRSLAEGAKPASEEEPALKLSTGRFLSEPVSAFKPA